MAHLTLAGMSEDGKRLLLVDDQGNEHTLDADATLRRALRGEHERLGQLEIDMDSALRPRDIQARIRAGETPEAVAQAAQTTVDRIMPFANPVLAERAHVADRAQRASVRRPAGEAGARTLGDAVGRHLRGLNVAEDTVEWDAWRREDGRWSLSAAFATSARKGTASFSFDAPGNFVTIENEDAKWLVGEQVDKPRSTGTRQPRQRRLSSVAADELPLGEDAIEMVSDEPAATEDAPATAAPTEDTVDLDETAARVRRGEPVREPAAGEAAEPEVVAEPERSEEPASDAFLASAFRRQNPAGARETPSPGTEANPDDAVDGASPVDSEPVHEARDAEADGDGAATEDTQSADEADPAPARRPVSKKRGRASVPSWDEIMFGGSDKES